MGIGDGVTQVISMGNSAKKTREELRRTDIANAASFNRLFQSSVVDKSNSVYKFRSEIDGALSAGIDGVPTSMNSVGNRDSMSRARWNVYVCILWTILAICLILYVFIGLR